MCAMYALRISAMAGLTLPAQDNDVVDPRPDLSVRPFGKALNGFHAYPLPIIAEFQRTDDLLGAWEVVMAMVEFRRPRRRTCVVDDQQHPARPYRGRSTLEQPRPIERNHRVQKLRGDQVESAIGKTVGQVVLDEVDPIGQPLSLRGGGGALQRSV